MKILRVILIGSLALPTFAASDHLTHWRAARPPAGSEAPRRFRGREISHQLDSFPPDQKRRRHCALLAQSKFNFFSFRVLRVFRC
jgi:hypothetical protein